MAEQPSHVTRVLEGEVTDLPPVETDVIRMFLSSTFTDHAEERNALLTRATPRIKTYCRERGLDYQVSDMRWGVQEDAQVKHSTTEQCLHEITKSRAASRGPYFITLLGNKYGYRPFPRTILEDEFLILYRAANTAGKDTSLLEKWYRKDRNSVPAEFVLQPITSQFPYYSDLSEENKEKHEKDVEGWEAVSQLLTNIFHAAAVCALKYGKFTADQKHKYYMSVTENEVHHGIFQHPEDNEKRTLAFIRNISGINTSDVKAGRYMDLEGSQPDQEAQDLLQDLKETRMPNALPSSNIFQYEVNWTEAGIDPSNNEHAQYLDTLVDDFTNKWLDLIDECLEQKVLHSTNKALYNEVLHHAHFCAKKCQHFLGREDALTKVQKSATKKHDVPSQVAPEPVPSHGGGSLDQDLEALKEEEGEVMAPPPGAEPPAAGKEVRFAATGAQDSSEEKEMEDEDKQLKNHLGNLGIAFGAEQEEFNVSEMKMVLLEKPSFEQFTQPLILYGDSGSGKTALMAKVAHSCPSWFKCKPVRIVRFLGTTPSSSHISGTLMSVIEQIWENYGHKPSSVVDMSHDFCFLKMYFHALLGKVNDPERPLVIILDSVDQLAPDDYAHSLSWLPLTLPPDVHIVVSMLPEKHACLDNARSRLADPECFMHLSALTVANAREILQLWAGAVGRALTREQLAFIINKFRRCSTALYLKLAFEQARMWTSYSKEASWNLGHTVKMAIWNIFDKLEEEHGHTVVTKAFGYLSAATGLGDSEMEDVLSCDDPVLQDTYLFHLPPNPELIRLPPLLWSRVRYDCREYLTERQYEGSTVVAWYHRQFWETAEMRYTAGARVLSALHSALADYYLAKWADTPKPLTLHKKKTGSYPNAMRGVPSQPLVYANNIYNSRKLKQMPMHLVCSGRFDEFVSECVANFSWLYYKTKALGIKDVISSFKMATLKMEATLASREKQATPPPPATSPQNMSDEELEKKLTAEISGDTDEANNKDDGDGGDIFALTEKKELGKEEIELLLSDVDCVLQLLTMGLSSIARDVNNLPLQIVGQLGLSSSVTGILGGLRDQALAFMEATPIPLLTPHTRCLPAPGGDLIASIEVAVHYQGDGNRWEQKFSLSESGTRLYVWERSCSGTTSKSAGAGGKVPGDVQKVLDLTRDGQEMSQQQMYGQEAMRIELFGGDRFLYMALYTERDRFDPRTVTVVMDQATGAPVPLPEASKIVAHSRGSTAAAGSTTPWLVLTKDEWVAKMKVLEARKKKKVKHKKIQNIQDESTTTGTEDEEPKEDGEDKKPAPAAEPKYSYLVMGYAYNPDRKDEVSLKLLSKSLLSAPPVDHAVFSPDHKWVVLFSPNCSAYSFLVETGKHVKTFDLSDGEKNTTFRLEDEQHWLRDVVHITPSERLVCPGRGYNQKKNLYVFNLQSGETEAKFEDQDYEIDLVTFNEKMTKVASASRSSGVMSSTPRGKPIVVYNLQTMTKMASFFGSCNNHIESNVVKFLGPYEEFVAVNQPNYNGPSGNIVIFYIGTAEEPLKDGQGIPVHRLIGHTNDLQYMGFSSSLIITGSLDNTVKLWSLERVVECCRQRVAQVGGSYDVEALTRRFFNSSPNQPTWPGEGPIVTTAMAVSKDGSVAAVGTHDGWMIFYTLHDQQVLRYERGGDSAIHTLLCSNSGKFFVSANSKSVTLWEPSAGAAVREIGRPPGMTEGGGEGAQKLSCLAEASDVIVCGYGGMECYGVVWDLNTGAHLATLQGLYGFNVVDISLDAKYVVSTFFEFPVVYSVQTGEPITEMDTDKMDVQIAGASVVRISPCCRLVAVSSNDGSVRVITLTDGKYKFRMQHRSSVREMTFTRDGRRLVTAGFRTILLWSMANGQLITSLSRHQDFITRMVLACNDKYLVTCGMDKQVIVWDLSRRGVPESITAFTAHCRLDDLAVARHDLSSIIFRPLNIHYIGVLQPNPKMAKILSGEEVNVVPDQIQEAQNIALVFSSQRPTAETSRACTIL